MKKRRALIIYDVHKDSPNGRLLWAYGRRATALLKHCPPDFDVTICQFADIPWACLGGLDLIFNLEYASPSNERFRANGFRGILVVSFNSDSHRRQELWAPVTQQADWTICNNADVFLAHDRQERTCAISNGIDADIFRPTVKIADRPHRLLWSGSTNPKKGKGFVEVLEPLMERLSHRSGFECSFRQINQIDPAVVYTTQQQVDWYNSGSYVLCASLSEGTPGISVEGMACGCVPISVPVGNIREIGRPDENCVLVERTVDSFIDGLEYAREHRARLSAAAVETMRGCSYGPPGNRAAFFFQLFRRLVDDGPDSVKPFVYNEIDWSEI